MLHSEVTLGMDIHLKLEVDVDPGLQQNLLQSNVDAEHHNCRPYAVKFLETMIHWSLGILNWFSFDSSMFSVS